MKNCTENLNWKLANEKSRKTHNHIKNLRILDYDKNPKLCLKCLKPLPYVKKSNKFCSIACAASYNTKGRVLTSIHKLKISNGVKNSSKPKRIYYPKPKQIRICPICNHEHYNTTYCSRKCFLTDQKNGYKFSNKPCGGIRPGGGQGKHGKYKGILCDSTYELIWVIYNIDHNIQFQRNKQRFKYVFKEKEHNYYPDFICNNEYIEIKGFMRETDYCKISQFPDDLNLKVLNGTDLKEQFNYVHSTYGKDLVSLYDK